MNASGSPALTFDYTTRTTNMSAAVISNSLTISSGNLYMCNNSIINLLSITPPTGVTPALTVTGGAFSTYTVGNSIYYILSNATTYIIRANVDILAPKIIAVGGGGGGGGYFWWGGGGGAGGLQTNFPLIGSYTVSVSQTITGSPILMASTDYSVTVGNGGAALPLPSANPVGNKSAAGNNGLPTTATFGNVTITANGGGGGAYSGDISGKVGGCGGGASVGYPYDTLAYGGSGTQGFSGGNARANGGGVGGGGGGISSLGKDGNAPGSAGGAGGTGLTFVGISFGGGGGGAGQSSVGLGSFGGGTGNRWNSVGSIPTSGQFGGGGGGICGYQGDQPPVNTTSGGIGLFIIGFSTTPVNGTPVSSDGSIVPTTNNTYNLGSASSRWNEVRTTKIYVTNTLAN
jgi:hypothetical protein